MRRALILLVLAAGCGGGGGTSAPAGGFSGTWVGTWDSRPITFVVSPVWDPVQERWTCSGTISGTPFNGSVSLSGQTRFKANGVRYVSDIDRNGDTLTGAGYYLPGSVPFTATMVR